MCTVCACLCIHASPCVRDLSVQRIDKWLFIGGSTQYRNIVLNNTESSMLWIVYLVDLPNKGVDTLHTHLNTDLVQNQSRHASYWVRVIPPI